MKHIETAEKALLWLTIGSLGLGQLGKVALGAGTTAYPHEVVMAVWAILLLIHSRNTLKDKALAALNFCKTYTYAWMPFAAVALFSVVLALATSFTLLPLLYLARISYYLLFGVLSTQLSHLPRQVVSQAVVGLGGITAATGFLQFFLLPDTRFLFILGYDDHYYRMIGTHLDPAFQGALLLISAFVAAETKVIRNAPYFFAGYVATLITALVLTFSRASYLGVLVWGVLLVRKNHFRKRQWLYVSSAILGTLAILFIAAYQVGGEGTKILRTSTIEARLSAASESVPQNTREALIGSGLFSVHRDTSRAVLGGVEIPNQAKLPNSLFELLLQGTGLLGVTAFLYLCWIAAPKVYAYSPKATKLVLMLVVMSQFNNTLLQPAVLLTTILAVQGLGTKEYR